jgi:hypothetical protein
MQKRLPRTTINHQIRTRDITAEPTCQEPSYTANFNREPGTLESDVLLLILSFVSLSQQI